mgnify:CR=1 FL=1
MKENKLTIGIIILVIGIALIVVSQTVSFVKAVPTSIPYVFNYRENTTLKYGILFAGIAGFVVGGVVLALGLKKKEN